MEDLPAFARGQIQGGIDNLIVDADCSACQGVRLRSRLPVDGRHSGQEKHAGPCSSFP
jgi:hypothetical protein